MGKSTVTHGSSFIEFNFKVKLSDFVQERSVNVAEGLSDAFKKQFNGFEDFLNAQLAIVTNNLAKSGVTEIQKALREATTGWGKARMRGEYFGVNFTPYGRSEGREETGTMYDSVSSSIETGKDNDGFFVEGKFGWSKAAIAKNPYIVFQEMGFYSTGRFDPAATRASGTAKFTTGPPKFIRGAASKEKASREVAKRVRSGYSAAWNEAVKQYNAGGFAGSPKKPPKAPTGYRRV